MNKRKWLCVFLCCGLLLTTLAACSDGGGSNDPAPTPAPPATPAPTPAPPPTVYEINFADGKHSFLSMNTGAPGTDPDSKLEIANVDGANALRMTAPNGKALRLGINLDGLLGSRAVDVKTVVLDVYAEYPDGNFSAVSGRISAMSGDTTPFSEDTWQIYLASRNPIQAIFEVGGDGFSAAGPNLVEFSCTTNGPASRGDTPAAIVIKSIAFYDSGNEAIKADTAAGWAAPEGYGEFVLLGGWMLPYPTLVGSPGDWEVWFTPGVDGNDDEHMPWEVVVASFGIVFVVPDEPEGGIDFVYHGQFNNWGWPSTNIADFWADGEITVMWNDIGFDTNLVTADQNQVKMYLGNWNLAPVEMVYLLYDEDAMP